MSEVFLSVILAQSNDDKSSSAHAGRLYLSVILANKRMCVCVCVCNYVLTFTYTTPACTVCVCLYVTVYSVVSLRCPIFHSVL